MVTTLDNALLEEILQQVRPLIGQGKVADYIPALAEVPADRLAIAVCTVDGELFQAGDAALGTQLHCESVAGLPTGYTYTDADTDTDADADTGMVNGVETVEFRYVLPELS